MRKTKNSGVDWIGDIPEGWEISKIKFVADFEPKCDFSMLSPDSIITYTPMENIKNGYYVPNTAALRTLAQTLTAYQENDIVMAKVTPCFENGNIAVMNGLSSKVGLGSSELFVFRAKAIQTRFLFYWLQNIAFVEQAKATMTGTGGLKRVSPQFVRNCVIHNPPSDEQQRIANFLDAECARINAVIEKTRASIEEYKKLKQSVITEAVTKGIRPGRKMKDSGVEWIGEIPEEWAIIRLQHIAAAIESGTSVNAGQAAASAGELGVLKTSCVSRYVFLPEENKSVNKDEENRVSCPVRKNTIIVSRMNTPELVGACGYVSQDYDNLFLPDRLWQVHFKPNTNVKYIYYWLRSACVRNYYSSLAVGTSSSMQNISQDQFYHACCPYPAAEEQKEIVAFLDEKCNSIDLLIDMKSKFLAELESYKKSLIFEYVTGKKET